MRDTVDTTLPDSADVKLLLEVKMHSTTRRLKKRTTNKRAAGAVMETKPVQQKVLQQKSPMSDLQPHKSQTQQSGGINRQKINMTTTYQKDDPRRLPELLN